MKKLLFFCLALSLAACEDDIKDVTEKNIPETPPQGLKMKMKEGYFTHKFFYHSNGFVDSISITRNNTTSEKFIYNNLNQVVEVRYHSGHPDFPQYDKDEITYYTYNSQDQIDTAKTYDKNNTLLKSESYSYNSDGSLNNPMMTVKDENLIIQKSGTGTSTFTFDSFRNPYYNIYPKAYRTIKYINKNNIIKRDETYGSTTVVYPSVLKYNPQNYIIEERIQNAPLDSDDYNQFFY